MGDLRGAQDMIGLASCVAGFALEVRPELTTVGVDSGTFTELPSFIFLFDPPSLETSIVSFFAELFFGPAWEERNHPPRQRLKHLLLAA